MLDIALSIYFCVMAIRIAKALWQETAILQEFNLSKSLNFLVLLFPLGPVLYLTTAYRLGWLIALILTVACYLPSMVVARRHLSIFERSGTARVDRAENATKQAFNTAMVGLIYAAVVLVFTLLGYKDEWPSA